MKLLTVIVALLLNTGCISALTYPPSGPKHYKPDTPHPTAARIAELAKIDKPLEDYDGPFEVIIYPQVLLAGSGVRVRCMVPVSHRANEIRYGIQNLSMSEGPADKYEFVRTFERVPCGTWVASCILSDGKRRDKEFTAIGDCNQDRGF